jgi:hypothetical protein
LSQNCRPRLVNLSCIGFRGQVRNRCRDPHSVLPRATAVANDQPSLSGRTVRLRNVATREAAGRRYRDRPRAPSAGGRARNGGAPQGASSSCVAVEVPSSKSSERRWKRQHPASVIRLAAGLYQIYAEDPYFLLKDVQGLPDQQIVIQGAPAREDGKRATIINGGRSLNPMIELQEHYRRRGSRPIELHDLLIEKQFRTERAINCVVFENVAHLVIKNNVWTQNPRVIRRINLAIRAESTRRRGRGACGIRSPGGSCITVPEPISMASSSVVCERSAASSFAITSHPDFPDNLVEDSGPAEWYACGSAARSRR